MGTVGDTCYSTLRLLSCLDRSDSVRRLIIISAMSYPPTIWNTGLAFKLAMSNLGALLYLSRLYTCNLSLMLESSGCCVNGADL